MNLDRNLGWFVYYRHFVEWFGHKNGDVVYMSRAKKREFFRNCATKRGKGTKLVSVDLIDKRELNETGEKELSDLKRATYAELLVRKDEHALTELKRRDADFLIQHKSIEISEQALDLASICLMHHFVRSQHFGNETGFFSWMMSITHQLLRTVELVQLEKDLYFAQYNEAYFYFERRKSNAKRYNLVYVSSEYMTHFELSEPEGEVRIRAHSINRLTTRFLTMYLSKPFMEGVGLVTWLKNVCSSLVTQFYSKLPHGALARYENATFIFHQDEREGFFKLVTLY